jgi:catechol 2,3-dioxygenase-like lactoylglutathione lyase family enzyme
VGDYAEPLIDLVAGSGGDQAHPSRIIDGKGGSMGVQRIVANLATDDVARARAFYADVLGLKVVMDHGWIVTFAAHGVTMMPQLSVASEGGSGTPVPDVSIEVDDLDDALARMAAAQIEVVYGPADEPWGVRRFFVRDPLGRLVNILTHA